MEKHKCYFQTDLGAQFLSPTDSQSNAGSKVTEVLLQTSKWLVVKTSKSNIHQMKVQVFLRTFHNSFGRAKRPLTSKKSWVFFSRCLSSVSSREFCFSVCWFWLASSSSASSFSSTVCLGSKHIQKNSEAHIGPFPG